MYWWSTDDNHSAVPLQPPTSFSCMSCNATLKMSSKFHEIITMFREGPSFFLFLKAPLNIAIFREISLRAYLLPNNTTHITLLHRPVEKFSKCDFVIKFNTIDVMLQRLRMLLMNLSNLYNEAYTILYLTV